MNSNMESKLMLNKLLATERNPERNRLNVTYVIIAVLKKVPTIPESTDSWIYGFLNLRIPESKDYWNYDSWIESVLSRIRFNFIDSWTYRFLNLRISEITIPESTDSWNYDSWIYRFLNLPTTCCISSWGKETI
jgi:hypothetical protein